MTLISQRHFYSFGLLFYIIPGRSCQSTRPPVSVNVSNSLWPMNWLLPLSFNIGGGSCSGFILFLTFGEIFSSSLFACHRHQENRGIGSYLPYLTKERMTENACRVLCIGLLKIRPTARRQCLAQGLWSQL